MAYSAEERESKLTDIFKKIEDGLSLRKALDKVNIPAITFYEWIDKDDEKAKQYARACKQRTENKKDSIADDYNAEPQYIVNDDGSKRIDPAWVQLQRLKIDAKKWELSKEDPKKYGDKIDLTSGGDKINPVPSSITVNVVMPEDE